VNSLADTMQYPLVCPACQRNTACSASQLLAQAKLICRHCGETIVMSHNQQQSLKRTLADLGSHAGKKYQHHETETDSPD